MEKESRTILKYLIISSLMMLLPGMYSVPIFAEEEKNVGLAPVLSGIIEGFAGIFPWHTFLGFPLDGFCLYYPF